MSYDMTDGGVAAYHRLQLEGREKLSVSGVEDVVRFDENCIVTTTSAGTLIITGEELHIGKLSLDGGEMQVDGRIDALDTPRNLKAQFNAQNMDEVFTQLARKAKRSDI